MGINFLRKADLVLSLGLVCLLCGCSNNGGEGLGKYPKAVSTVDEASAIQSLRTIATAETQAKAMRNSYADFNTLVQLGFLDERFAGTNPNIRGYSFTLVADENQYSVTADPQPSATAPAGGVRHLYMDSTDNAIHANATQTASRRDPQL